MENLKNYKRFNEEWSIKDPLGFKANKIAKEEKDRVRHKKFLDDQIKIGKENDRKALENQPSIVQEIIDVVQEKNNIITAKYGYCSDVIDAILSNGVKIRLILDDDFQEYFLKIDGRGNDKNKSIRIAESQYNIIREKLDEVIKKHWGGWDSEDEDED